MHSSSIVSDQFDDVAYSPVLLPNHGAGTGRGARLEILEASEPPSLASSDVHVDPSVHLHGLGHRAHARPLSPSAAGLPSPSPRPSSPASPMSPSSRAPARTRLCLSLPVSPEEGGEGCSPEEKEATTRGGGGGGVIGGGGSRKKRSHGWLSSLEEELIGV